MSAADRQKAFNAIVRTDFESFVRKCFQTLSPGQQFIPAWYIRAIAYQLDRVRRGELRRLIINLPPRSLKSITTSVAFPAFLLGRDPTRRIICASYSGELSRKLSNDFRAILEARWYRAAFPNTQVGAFKDSEGEIELTARGFRLATSVGGTLTGRGGDIIIVDDPLKPIDALSEPKRSAVNQWFNNTLISRLDDKKSGAIVVVMQRVHKEDLTGFLLSQSDEWEVLSLPAIAENAAVVPIGVNRFHRRALGDVLSPEREPRAILESLRLQLGSELFSAQFQQAPVPPGGAMVKRDWVKRYSTLPTDNEALIILQSWDTAVKGGPENDFSVCTTWQCRWEKFHLVDLWRGRVDYPALKRKVLELSNLWTADQVLMEDAGTASALLQELEYEVRGLTGIRPDRDKATRMSVASAKIEAGQVFFPERAAWLPELETELFSFPGDRHDDQVDSISQALNHRSDALMYARLVD